MSDDQVYIANTAFSTDFEGASLNVSRGERVRGSHPLYRQCPTMFDPVDDHVRFDVETASATPGEDRGSRPLSPVATVPPGRPAEKPVEKPAAKPAPAPAAKSKSKN